MAIYRKGQASMDADGYITGYGTEWKNALTLIRPGATIVFATNPVAYATISEIINDTSLRATSTGGAVVPQGDYVILLHDSITVDGLAQDVAETLRYYQGQETMYQEFVEFLKGFDLQKLEEIDRNTEANAAAADASAKAAAQSESNANASKNAAAASATTASQQASSAASSSSAAKVSENNAASSKTAAANSASSASTSATTAGQHNDAAAASASAAKTSETNANASKTAAASSASAAKTSETNAKASETSAASSASAANTAKNEAQTAASSANASKSAAASSATAAAGSATTAKNEADRAAELAKQLDATNLMRKDANLSDVSNKATARNNLQVDKHVQGSDRTLIQSPQVGDDRYALMVHQSGIWGCYNEKDSQYVALKIDQGGTGAKDAAGARKNIGIDGFGLGLSSGAGVISNETEGSSVNLANGFYATNGDYVGTPFGVGNGQFVGLVSFNCTNGNNYKFQLAGSYSGSGRMFFRSMNNGIYMSWHEIASLQNANTWTQKQTCLSQFKSSTSWPALELDKTTIAEETVGRRIVIEHNDSSLNFYFSKAESNDGRYTIMMQKPTNSESRFVSYEGGLAVNGTSNPSDTGNDFSTVHQGWRNISGSAVNSPSGAAADNVYGSLFTQATQGLGVGRAKAQGVNNQWYQQRFYDTSNRIFSRVQTDAAAWGGWQQVTMYAVSDERLKYIKGNLNVEGALDNINRMEFKLFNFKEEMIQGKAKTTRRGVISQQIRMIDKEYVKNVGGYWHLDQTPMLLDGLAAIKALRARDEENKERIAKLEGEVEELKAMVAALIAK